MTPGEDRIFDSCVCPGPIEIIAYILALDDEHGDASRFGTFSGSIHDTAWLSMVLKFTAERREPLFPECFEHLLESQQSDGAWGTTPSQVDSILNSLAGLLALVTRRASKLTDGLDSKQLDLRIERARLGIKDRLQDWDPSQDVHVGFEILVPSLLRQVEEYGIRFHFPGHSTLMYLHNQKLRKFDHSLVYSSKPTTLLHSLEAFVGLVDFGRVGHHCTEASGVFGSPAATAAYLINAPTWDDRAERYLRTVVAAKRNTGIVPSAYPTCIFELSWTLSTILAPGVLPRQLRAFEKEKLRHLFETSLHDQDGAIGFAPGVLEDADDTARTLMTLQDLGKPASPEGMIHKFQTDQHFRTYELEGSPSFSANCHVVLSLTGYDETNKYAPQLQRALTFLLEAEESGPLSDKWNVSPQYCRMLFMQTLLSLLKRHNDGYLESFPADIIHARVPGCICRLLSQTLSDQRADGSWAESLEVTAYSILTLSHCLSLPWPLDFKFHLNESLKRGQQYLRARYGTTDDQHYLWIEKISYRSSILHSTYCSAALNICIVEHIWNNVVIDCFTPQRGISQQMKGAFSSLPLFQQSPLRFMDLAFIEAGGMAKRLRSFRDTLFTRDDIPMTADKYVDLIPMVWVACNHKSGHILSAYIVWEMILLSLLNFQVDEYMESVVGRIEGLELQMLEPFLRQECGCENDRSHSAADARTRESDLTDRVKKRKMSEGKAYIAQNEVPAVASASRTLSRFIQHVIKHASVLRSPPSMQRELAREVYDFLVAHITHNQDSVAFALLKGSGTQDDMQAMYGKRTYIDWVSTTASDDTSCPFSFLFFTILISARARNCFQGARANYLSRRLGRHLATMCRQYNDYGSVERDAEECNLNSLDFPEFQSVPGPTDGSCNANGFGPGTHGSNPPTVRPTDVYSITTAERNKHESSGSKPEKRASKDDLMAIADFERSCMQLALEKLTNVSPSSTIQKLQVFIDVTDAFGQIYVQKDIASRLQCTS
ncbi:MAG: hypothetical protein Q9204_000679 [Flavoplaca sp. TL-2023a]